MKTTISYKFLFVILALTTMFSCKKDNPNLDSALFGKWNVTKVEGQQYNNGTAGMYLSDNNPTGWVRFDKNGWGEQNYTFTLLGATYPNTGKFKWEANDSQILIDRQDEPDMVWHRKVNQPDLQKATYNIVVSSSQNWDYTLTLEK